MREEQLKIIEEHLNAAIGQAHQAAVSKEELVDMLTMLYEEV